MGMVTSSVHFWGARPNNNTFCESVVRGAMYFPPGDSAGKRVERRRAAVKLSEFADRRWRFRGPRQRHGIRQPGLESKRQLWHRATRWGRSRRAHRGATLEQRRLRKE